MRPILALMQKDLALLWRDKFALFWVFVFPLIMGLFFGAVSGGSGGERGKMAIAVVDNDRSATSEALVEKLRKSESIRIVEPRRLGVGEITPDIASNAVRRGDLTGYVVLDKGFGDSLLRFGPGDRKPMIQLGMDPSRKAEEGFLQGIILESAYSLLGRQFMDPAMMRPRLKEALGEVEKATDLNVAQKLVLGQFFGALTNLLDKVDAKNLPSGSNPFGGVQIASIAVTNDQARPKTAWEITFPSAVLWGVLGCMITFAISIVTEKRMGTLLRLRIAPLSRTQILAGKGMACFATCTAAAVTLLVIGKVCFQLRFSSVPYLALAVVCTSLCFVGVMMLLSVMGRSEQAVSGSASAAMVVMAMLGGGMIPLFAMPSWMQTVSSISPVKWGIVALEGAIWRDFTLSEMMFPCGVLLAVGVSTFAVGAWILSKREL